MCFWNGLVECAQAVLRCCAMLVQLALMRVVPSAVAALDAHRGIVEVAKSGLDFLQRLSATPESQVMP